MTEPLVCDACVARAINSILLPSGGTIILCQHHTNKNVTALKEIKAKIIKIEETK